MFSVGDIVTVMPDIRTIEMSAGRNTCTECMSIGDKTWSQGLRGVVIEVEAERGYGRFLRNIYKVDFGDESLPCLGESWVHEEWIYRDEDFVCDSTKMDAFLSES
jgi:hypothetical protein